MGAGLICSDCFRHCCLLQEGDEGEENEQEQRKSVGPHVVAEQVFVHDFHLTQYLVGMGCVCQQE